MRISDWSSCVCSSDLVCHSLNRKGRIMQDFTLASRGARLIYLDWIRVGAFGLLILFHVGMFYVTWDWHVKSDHVSHAIEPLMLASSPWRLTLLFLVSGVATDRKSTRLNSSH